MTNQKNTDLYLAALFNQDERVCFGKSAYDIASLPVISPEAASRAQYVTLNPIEDTRKDENVTKFRNILIEIDKGSLTKQRNKIVISDIPFTTLVYSGGKSYHLVISLKDELSNRETYDKHVRAIYEAFDPDNKWVDHACKNPSRFTRIGGVRRHNNDAEQTIVDIRGRVDRATLDTWLIKNLGIIKWGNLVNVHQTRTQNMYIKPVQQIRTNDDRWWHVSKRSKEFLKTGIPKVDWRSDAMFFCCDLYRCGYDESEVYEKLLEVDGYLEKDCEHIPAECYKKILHSGEIGIKLEQDTVMHKKAP